MSWTSRFNNLGRFSPFTRSPQNSVGGAAPKVSDSDFSYITAEDLRQHEAASVSAVTDSPRAESPTEYGGSTETDVLILRNKKQDYALHFSAYSIVMGELTIGSVRQAAAKRMGISDPRRIKLLYRGRNLKDDSRTCKQEALKDGSEIMCTFTDADYSDGEDGESGSDGDGSGEAVDGGDGARRRRNRGKKTKRRNKREAATAGQDSRSSTPDNRGLDVPLSRTSTRTPSQSHPTSRTASPKPPATPATPLDKLGALHDTLISFKPGVEAYIRSPPVEQKQKEFEYKRLSETIMAQVLLKLDEVSTEGDVEARSRRKALVKETQELLGRLDEYKPKT